MYIIIICPALFFIFVIIFREMNKYLCILIYAITAIYYQVIKSSFCPYTFSSLEPLRCSCMDRLDCKTVSKSRWCTLCANVST